MLPLSPVLSSFPFAGIYISVNIYSISWDGPMHCLSLGVGRRIIECIIYFVGDNHIERPAMGCQNGNMGWFKFMYRLVFSTLNAFLERCFRKAPGYKLKVIFFKARTSDCLTGLFNENELHGMLEALDFDTGDNFSLFWVPFFNAFCGLSRTAEVTIAVTT